MFTDTEYSVFDFASCISEALDLVSPALNDHHKRVAYISYMLAKEMLLPEDTVRDIVLAAILHDIGAFTNEERLEVVFAKFNDTEFDNHQVRGYKLLRNFEPFANAAALIKDHHAHFDKQTTAAPVGCHVIHLADRVAILLHKDNDILTQVPAIMESVEKHRKIFHPDTLEALRGLAKMEYFWIDACLLQMDVALPKRMRFPKRTITVETLGSLAKLISQIIDFRSRFTATHSSGVAAVAAVLAAISGFSERECQLVKVAGYLHDIGKLAISNDILEKNGALNHEEFNEMRKHSYHTYIILNKIKGFEQIAEWAAYHHERLDGNGYPFHVKGENFTKLARIIAVADIVTAITEDRPYRTGMSGDKALGILADMVANGGIDKDIVEIVKENFAGINEARVTAQEKAREEYDAFYSPALA